MGKLKLLNVAPLTSIQDKGRFGCRKYGIPQSGAMDEHLMRLANGRVGNLDFNPVIEFALGGLVIEALSDLLVGWAGTTATGSGQNISSNWFKMRFGDKLELSAPNQVYGYLSVGGRIQAKNDFGSISTYELAKLGGLDGRNLQLGATIETVGEGSIATVQLPKDRKEQEVVIRYMKGPEFTALSESLDDRIFYVDASSNRMGIRLSGEPIDGKIKEIISSAVIPGIIQLPENGQPIVLMKDCQTIGGYPRVGKVLDEDLGKIAQVGPGKPLRFSLASI